MTPCVDQKALQDVRDGVFLEDSEGNNGKRMKPGPGLRVLKKDLIMS